MIIPQTYVTLATPVILSPRMPSRIPGAPQIAREFSSFPLTITIDAARRELRATLSPLPGGLLLYGPDDFTAACADAMEDHADRVLEILGTDPAATLQALIDRVDLPAPPPRVPREIANWRAKAVLAAAGLSGSVEFFLAGLPEPQRSVAVLAWNGDAKVSRKSPLITALAAALDLSATQLDDMFRAAEAITI